MSIPVNMHWLQWKTKNAVLAIEIIFIQAFGKSSKAAKMRNYMDGPVQSV